MDGTAALWYSKGESRPASAGAGQNCLEGAEIKDYTEVASAARDTALEKMKNEARSLGADAVMGVRLVSTLIAEGRAMEVLAYGTAVKIK